MPRHGYGNIAKNKISFEKIYRNKRCAQGKAVQKPTFQLLQYNGFADDVIHKQNLGATTK